MNRTFSEDEHFQILLSSDCKLECSLLKAGYVILGDVYNIQTSNDLGFAKYIGSVQTFSNCTCKVFHQFFVCYAW